MQASNTSGLIALGQLPNPVYALYEIMNLGAGTLVVHSNLMMCKAARIPGSNDIWHQSSR